jgi:hypothetical protein
MAQCSGIKRDGGRCRSQAIQDSSWCFNHHPDYEQQRKAAVTRGGRRGGRGRPQTEIARICERLEVIAESVISGELDSKRGSVGAQALNYVLGGLKVGLMAREQEELVARLEVLEEGIQEKKRRRQWGA